MNVRTAMIVWAVAIPVLAATWLWLVRSGAETWPFNRPAGSPPPSRADVLFRYELVFAVFLAYVTLRSLPVWWRYRRIALHDANQIDRLISIGRFREAAECLHRYCLVYSAVWRRLPARVGRWDEVLRRQLQPGRRLYIYYRTEPPPLPEDPTSSFMPEVVPVGQPRWWTLLGLLPIGLALYMLVMTILQDRSNLYRLFSFNSILMIGLLVGYGTFYARWILGRSSYVRFGPGVAQLLKYTVLGHKPIQETFDLRVRDVVLDLTGRSAALTILANRQEAGDERAKPRTFRLPTQPEVIRGCLRAVLSTAQTPPLDEEDLVG